MLEQAPDLATTAGWLPLAFMVVMGLAILAYVILDGFDLGVGLLLQLGDGEDQKDTMIASDRSGMQTKPGWSLESAYSSLLSRSRTGSSSARCTCRSR